MDINGNDRVVSVSLGFVRAVAALSSLLGDYGSDFRANMGDSECDRAVEAESAIDAALRSLREQGLAVDLEDDASQTPEAEPRELNLTQGPRELDLTVTSQER